MPARPDADFNMRSIELLKFPLWIVALFTRAKSFKKNPVLGNRTLNRCGLHVLRIISAWCIYNFRQAVLFFLIRPEDRAAFKHKGFIVKQNFLGEETFARLLEEISSYQGDAWESIQGDTITQHIFLDNHTLKTLPRCRQLVNDPDLLSPMKWCAGKASYPRFFIQEIKNHYAEGIDDPQKVLHSDTFHPAVKCWFFLQDVSIDDGPFTYVPGSHRLTLKKLRWLYHKSCEAAALHDGHSEDGSFRVRTDELDELGLPAPEPLTVRKNTLVIADTSGFHCRGTVVNKGVRSEIFGFFRPNPFNPLPGLDIQALRKLNQSVIRKFYYYRDSRERKQGRQAFWHLVKIK